MHEMAHMWFGDLVTMQWWDDLWLKESFADYMGTLAVDRATDWETAWVGFANKRKGWAYVQDQLPTTHPIVADIPDLEAAKQNFDGITYAKGASVLKQLVAYAGFDAFIAGSRQYFRDHAYGNTTLADLLSALSAASGRDLAAWAAQWLQTSGISTLSLDLTADDGVLRAVTIVQDALDPVSGREELRPHRLHVGLYNFDDTGALVRTGSVETDAAGHRTDVPELAGRRRPALLLLNDDDLTYAKVRLDPASEATVLASLDRLTDPMARALCWTALWNSARDAESPAARYVRAVTAFGPSETGIGVLLNILGNAETAVEHYTAVSERDMVRRDFLNAAADRLGLAAPGSDHQLGWARTVAAVSRRDDSLLPRLRGILDGTASIEGLAVDAELRWNIWHALAANGQATVAELDAELTRDTTASGRVGHATALAARPDPEVKAAAWKEAVHGTELSNQLLSATIAGFTTAAPELLEPYVEPYFDCLRDVWENRSIEIASRIVRGLYPSAQDLHGDGARPEQQAVVLRTDAWLAANADAPAALRRIIVEQRSHLLRALTAQAAGASSTAP
jgi:aminopeptidase N